MSTPISKRALLTAIMLLFLAVAGCVVTYLFQQQPNRTFFSRHAGPAPEGDSPTVLTSSNPIESDPITPNVVDSGKARTEFDPLEIEESLQLVHAGDIRCSVPGLQRGVWATVQVGEIAVPARTAFAGQLVIVPISESGDGFVQIHGFEPTTISWNKKADGKYRCEVGSLTEALMLFVFGTVLDSKGDLASGAFVEGCGSYATTNGLGEFELPRISSSPCSLHAFGGDLGDETADELVFESTTDATVDLQAAAKEIVGLILSGPTNGSLVWTVEAVVEGGAAERAGIERGDEIAFVGGQSTESLPPVAIRYFGDGEVVSVELLSGAEHVLFPEPAYDLLLDAGYSRKEAFRLIRFNSYLF